jgi:hypothetical protein
MLYFQPRRTKVANRKYGPEILKQIENYYLEGLCSREIHELVGISQKVIQKIAKREGYKIPPQGGPGGERAGQWKGGKTIDKNGYVLIHKPGHPSCNSGGYVREHRLVMEGILGRYLTREEVVHHKDGNKMNNNPDNLQVYANNGLHLAEDLPGRPHNVSPENRKKLSELMRKRRTKVFPSPDSLGKDGLQSPE